MDFNEYLCFLIMGKVRGSGKAGRGGETQLGDSEDKAASSGQMDAMLPSLLRFYQSSSHVIEGRVRDVIIVQGSK